MVEYWKPISSFPGYEVSDHGRVRSFWRRTRDMSMGNRGGTVFVLDSQPQRLLAPDRNQGYLRVQLYRAGKPYRRLVHQLVLVTFTERCPEGQESCHADGSRSNNFLTNLSWGTKSKNSLDSVHHGTHPGLTHQGMGHPLAKLTDEQVVQIRMLYAHGHLQKDIARRFGVVQQTIHLIVTHKRWTHLP